MDTFSAKLTPAATNSLPPAGELFRQLVESSPTAITVTNPDGTVAYRNPAAIRLAEDALVEMAAQSDLRALWERAASGQPGAVAFQVTTRAGACRWLEAQKTPLRNEAGQITAVVTATRQLVSREESERQLQHSLSLLTATLEATADGILVVDAQGRFVSSNQRFSELWRLPADIIASGDDGRAIAFAVAQLKEPEAFLRKVQSLYAQPNAESIDVLEFTDGRVFERYSRPQRVAGETVGRVWSFRDVTEQRRAAEALRLSEQRLHAIVHHTPNVAIQIYDLAGRVQFWNAASEAMFGWTAAEALGKSLDHLTLTAEDAVEFTQMLRELSGTGKSAGPIEYHYAGARGDEGWCLSTLYQIPGTDDRPLFVCMEIDITARKLAEQAQRHTEERLHHALEATADGLWDWNIQTGDVYFSPQWARVLGYAPEEVPQRVEFFFTILHPDDVGRVQQLLEDHLAGRTPVKQDEVRLRMKSGAFRWFLDRGRVVVRDTAGKPLRMVGTITDITKRKVAEQRQAAFAALGRRLNAAKNSGEAATIITEIADELFAWDSSTVDLYDAQRDLCRSILNIDIIAGRRQDVPPRYFEAPPTPRMRRAMENSGVLVLREEPLKIEPGDIPFGDTSRPSASLMVVPLRDGREIVGVMSIHSYRVQAYTADDLQTLQALGDHCGGALARIRSREALDQSEARLREAQAIARIGNFHWHAKTNKLTWSDELFGIHGRVAGTLEPRMNSYLAAVHPEDRARVADAARAAIRTQLPFDEDYRVLWPDDQIRWVHARGIVLFGDDGKLAGMEGTCQDITERKRMESLLGVQKEVLELIASGAALPDSLTLLARSLEAQAGNILCSILLLEENGKHVTTGAAPSLPPEYRCAIDGITIGPAVGSCGTAMYRRAPVIVEDIAADPLWKDYRELALAHGLRACWSTPIEDARGRILGAFAIYYRQPGPPAPEHLQLVKLATSLAVIAITKNETDASLRVSHAALKSISQGVLITSRNGLIQSTNHAHSVITGFTEAELRGRYVDQILASRCDPGVLEKIRRSRERAVEFTGEFIDYRKDGTPFWNELTATPLRDEHGAVTHFISVMRDVTDRKQAKQALELMQFAVDRASDAIVWVASDARVLYANEATCRRLGVTRDALLKMSIYDFDPDFPKSAWPAHWEELKQRGSMIFETRHRTGDGRVIPVEVNANYVNFDGHEVNFAFSRDITERKQSEKNLRETEERLRQSQKLEAIGQLAGGVAHDFNNLLTTMMLHTDFAGLPASLPAETREALDGIRGAAQRAAELTRQLLLFSRRQLMQMHSVNLNDAVRNLVKLLQRTLGDNIRIQIHLSSVPLILHADAGMLDQVLMNLAVNSRDAMPAGGEIVIETGIVTLTARDLTEFPEATAGRYVCLSVADTGGGIAPDLLPHIFEPFFTTKEPGKGTGLGLATVFGIVKQHGGFIRVASAVGRGTTFKIFLPPKADAAIERDAEAIRPAPGGTETIFVVEDEPSVRKVTCRLLQMQGYRVIEAANGVEAIEVWERRGEPVDLLFTDLTMPEGLSGHELADRLCAQDPKLKVLFTSGHSAEFAGREIELLEGRNFLQKPSSSQQLLQAVRRCLDQ